LEESKLTASQIAACLQRIEFLEPALLNLQTLKKLHAACVAKIPFETLDLFSGKIFSLRLADLYDKIVVRRRGGGCYELNGLFYHLLQGLGFQVSISNAHLYDRSQIPI